MAKLFGLDIAKILNKNMGKGLRPAAVLKRRAAGRSATNPSAGQSVTYTRHSARGIVERDAARMQIQLGGTLVHVTMHRVSILGASVAGGVAPVPQDRVEVDGEVFVVEKVATDPARGLYVCLSRSTA